MPVAERAPISTTVVAAGWNNPTRCYNFDNNYADSTTNNAEQTFDYKAFSPTILGGQETLDKVFVKIKWYYKLTGLLTGDDCNITFTVKVYDGSSWTSYTVGYSVFNCTTANDESFTDTAGSNSIQTQFIDVTSTLNTLAKLNSAQTRLLTTLTADAGLTPQILVDAINIVACYHMKAGIMAPGKSVIRKHDYPQARKAFRAVSAYLDTK